MRFFYLRIFLWALVMGPCLTLLVLVGSVLWARIWYVAGTSYCGSVDGAIIGANGLDCRTSAKCANTMAPKSAYSNPFQAQALCCIGLFEIPKGSSHPNVLRLWIWGPKTILYRAFGQCPALPWASKYIKNTYFGV